MQTQMIPVILRRWRHGTKGVIALFPTLPAEHGLCSSYEHGEHGAVDYYDVLRLTRPVCVAQDAVELLQELARIGYALRIMQHATPDMKREACR
jgi:hypothetical protein